MYGKIATIIVAIGKITHIYVRMYIIRMCIIFISSINYEGICNVLIK